MDRQPSNLRNRSPLSSIGDSGASCEEKHFTPFTNGLFHGFVILNSLQQLVATNLLLVAVYKDLV